MKKGRLFALLGFVLVVVLGAVYTVNFLYEKEQTTEASFDVKSPKMGDIILKTVASGSIQPRQEILIKPQVSGIVRTVHVEAGDIVNAGDILAEVTIVPNMSALSSAENRLSRAKISRDDTKTTYDRNAELFEQGVVSAMDIQQFKLAYNQANEEVLGAEDNLRIVREGVASRGGAKSNTLIRSTIDGMILDVPVKKGNSVIEANNFNDGSTVASVADMKDLIFIGKIDESEVEKLHEGMDIIPKGVEESGAIQFEIKAAVALEEGQFLRAGYSANADVELDRRDNILTISETLVQYKKRQAFVEVETSPGIYESRDVELGLSDGLSVEVLSGLTLEDKLKVWNKPSFRR
jgi:HlyD family secretion protein